jgi:hypothetical protein
MTARCREAHLDIESMLGKAHVASARCEAANPHSTAKL